MKDYTRLTEKDIYWQDEAFWQSSQEPSYEEVEEIYYRLAELEEKIESGELCDREEVRKETAREILEPLYNVIMEHPGCCVNLSEDIKFLVEKYGIDLKDEE